MPSTSPSSPRRPSSRRPTPPPLTRSRSTKLPVQAPSSSVVIPFRVEPVYDASPGRMLDRDDAAVRVSMSARRARRRCRPSCRPCRCPCPRRRRLAVAGADVDCAACRSGRGTPARSRTSRRRQAARRRPRARERSGGQCEGERERRASRPIALLHASPPRPESPDGHGSRSVQAYRPAARVASPQPLRERRRRGCRARAGSSSCPRRCPGVFMRASLPRPSTSWTGTIAVCACEASASRISSQLGSSSSIPSSPRALERARRARRRSSAPTSRARCRCRASRCRRRVARRRRSGPRGPGSRNWSTAIPGSPSSLAQAVDRRRDHAEVLGDQRQLAELARDRVEEVVPGAAPPAPGERGLRAAGHGPVGDEAAEVVDARRVDELERAPEALDPPAVAGARASRASRRAGCPRAGRSRSSRRAARPRPRPRGRAPGRRGGRRSRARRRSARRRSATRASSSRTRGAPSTRARSAPGRRARRRRRTRPSRRPSTGGARRSSRPRPRSPPRPARRAGRASTRTPRRSGRASRARPAGRAGGSATTTGPRRASQSTKRYASSPSRPPGSEVGWSRTPLERLSKGIGWLLSVTRPGTRRPATDAHDEPRERRRRASGSRT